MRYLLYNIAHGRGDADLPHETSETSRNFRLHRDPGDLRGRLDAIAALARAHDADVVALNEVDFTSGDALTTWSFGIDHVDHIAEAAGYPHRYKGVKWNYQAHTLFRALSGGGAFSDSEILARVADCVARRGGSTNRRLWAGLTPPRALQRRLWFDWNPLRRLDPGGATESEERFVLRYLCHRVLCGNALLSRYPIAHARTRIFANEPLYRRQLGYGHSYIEATIAHPAGPIRVLHTHFDDAARARAGQARELAGRAAQIRGPLIVSGDLNENPGGPGIARFRTLGLDVADDATLTYSTRNPSERLDYVMPGGGLQLRSYDVLRATHSDHFPVLVTIDATAAANGR